MWICVIRPGDLRADLKRLHRDTASGRSVAATRAISAAASVATPVAPAVAPKKKGLPWAAVSAVLVGLALAGVVGWLYLSNRANGNLSPPVAASATLPTAASVTPPSTGTPANAAQSTPSPGASAAPQAKRADSPPATPVKKSSVAASPQGPSKPVLNPAGVPGSGLAPPVLAPVPASGQLASSSTASPTPAPAVALGAHPCEQITNACRDAGFVSGAGKSGNGLFADCIFPIIQGTLQPRNSVQPLPQIGADIVTACKVINPTYGHNPKKQGTETSTREPSPPTQ